MPLVCHVSDIHARGLSRHAEHRAAFKELLEHCRNRSVDSIVITGDTWHSKSQGLTPEAVDLIATFFKDAADVAPVHIMLGNHDLNLQNMSRMDALSPIIDAIGSPRIMLHKHSCVHPLVCRGKDGAPDYEAVIDGNPVMLCVYSCVDEDKWDAVKPVDGAINIALFHGSVAGATTDDGWKLEADLTTDFFDYHSYTLLGDIHRRQSLDAGGRIAYAGSFIPHDYSETDQKGFLLWDIYGPDDFDVEFVPISCAVPFVTIDWQGSAEATLEIVKAAPIGARYRLRSDVPVSHIDIKRIHDVFKHDKHALDIAYKIDNSFDRGSFEAVGHSLAKDDLNEHSTHMKLLRGYLGVDRFEEPDWDRVDEIVTDALADVHADDALNRGSHWSVKRLEFDGTFGYGKGNVVDFTKLSGVTGIFGPNQSGKSSIMGTLMYALFNSTDRGSMKNLHIINTQKEHCRAAVLLDIDGREHRVERQSVRNENKRRSEIYATTSLNFAAVDSTGDIVADLNGTERRDTDSMLRDTIGIADDFMLTSFAASSGKIRLDKFVSEGPTQRREIIARFMGIDVFERMFNAIKQEHDALRANMSKMPDQDWVKDIAALIEKQSVLSVEATQLEHDIASVRDELVAAEAAFASLPPPPDCSRRDGLVQRIAEYESLISEHMDSVASLMRQKTAIRQKIDDATAERDTLDIDALKRRRETSVELAASHARLSSQLDKETHILEQQIASVKRLSLVPCGDKYPTCMFIKDSHADKTKLDEQRSRVDALKSSLEPIAAALRDNDVKTIEADIDKHSELSLSISRAQLEASDTAQAFERKRVELAEAESNLERARAELSVVDVVVDDERSNALDVNIKRLREQLQSLDARRLACARELGALEQKLSDIERTKAEFERLDAEWRIYSVIGDAWSKTGLPSHVLGSQLQIINDELSRVLHGIVNFTLELSADVDTNALDIYIDDGKSQRIFELSSGMERMIGSLALRVALLNVSSLPKSDMLVIDEGFGVLDDTNIEAVSRLLRGLRKWFKHVIIVTHIDGLKDAVDNVIEVSVDEHGFSKVCYE